MARSAKRIVSICLVGASLVAATHFLLPPTLKGMSAWQDRRAWKKKMAQHAENLARHQENRPHYSDLGLPTPGFSRPGLGALHDLDQVRFIYAGAFHDEITVTVRPPGSIGEKECRLDVVVTRYERNESTIVLSREAKVAPEIFAELSGYVLRADVIRNSVNATDLGGLDGTNWYLEGTKGDFTLRHVRWCAIEYDPEFAAIGKRFLDLAEIKLSDKDAY